ncbi:hypothetical protein EGN72_09045 [Pseudorhodobacter sp. E13]|uniref:OmpP1/FadL family transporter n=1 Tax=Pseudorhodobacter sp. E13 TaxID=2487931 RepID=UPI000F8E5A07|nr:outer membrane protein transport protein [Pseudorhodobacter sp. E13]RUS60358.1 hypothetical protein EGN72_09045 [Pseudorhodobacter sp. E13]
MKKIVSTLGAIALTATAAQAGGVERSSQSASVLFEKGNYVEFSLGNVSPDVSGSLNLNPAAKTGNMAKSYLQLGGALKYSINDNLDAALIVDQPFGADVSYPVGTGYPLAGSLAELNSFSLTGLLKYKTASNISVYGGLRYQTLEATATLPAAGYTVVGKKDGGVGYVLGVAYEKPEIALRVALTYNSKIKHKVDTLENGVLPSTTTVNTPQSVNLEFQSGVAANTLVFGSVRWVEWSKFDISPRAYNAARGPLVSYAKNTVTFNLGVGRKLNDNWSVSASVGYEKAGGGFSSNLGPTDGKKSLTLGAVYTQGNMKITGGVSYVKLGDTNTALNATGTAQGVFTKNKAVGVGVKVGYSF